ncbi:MAG: F0F1 ATP synthase subunit A [Deltaproteobacteria bacterium]|nr:F0F1 ATP synthase subunit A [Deltaproteobacteria bacterium]
MHGLNWFAMMSPFVNAGNVHVITAIFVALLLLLMALIVRRNVVKVEKALVPSSKVSLTNFFEVLIESLLDLSEGILGADARKHFPFLATLFVFVFTSNLLGQIPGFMAPTSNFNTNLAMALCVFLYYNFMGIKEQGFINYFKHFMGIVPSGRWYNILAFLPLSLLIFAIEMFGNFLRVGTLSFRLVCNMNVDHMVLGAFSGLAPLIVPIFFMILGLFVSFVQAFVFTLLTMIYIRLATAHEEGHEAHH